MAHEDHVLRRSVEIEDEVGLEIVFPSTFEGSVVGGGDAAVEDCQFGEREEIDEVGGGGGKGRLEGDMNGYGNGDEAVPSAEQDLRQMGSEGVEDARSEISSMLGSVSEDVVIGTAEVVVLRSRRVPEESKEKVREWIGEMERILNGDGDEDRELVCFHGFAARNRRSARSARGRLGNEAGAQVGARDGDGGAVYDGSRVDGIGEVPVVPKEGEQKVGYAKEMNYREEKDEV
jgi:hypothetical protein